MSPEDSVLLLDLPDGRPVGVEAAVPLDLGVGHEVTDTRTEGAPVVAITTDLRDTDHGLLLVEHLADHWDWHPRQGGPGKTAWAEYVLPAGGRPAAAPFCPSSTAAPVPM
ncbi:hypothetical protein [Streptomyces lydicus]|uniref:hypothetical protein n=1 Tax=Streptomyces lydicus TaxID=47763 RepID=UPI00378F9382